MIEHEDVGSFGRRVNELVPDRQLRAHLADYMGMGAYGAEVDTSVADFVFEGFPYLRMVTYAILIADTIARRGVRFDVWLAKDPERAQAMEDAVRAVNREYFEAAVAVPEKRYVQEVARQALPSLLQWQRETLSQADEGNLIATLLASSDIIVDAVDETVEGFVYSMLTLYNDRMIGETLRDFLERREKPTRDELVSRALAIGERLKQERLSGSHRGEELGDPSVYVDAAISGVLENMPRLYVDHFVV